MNIKIISIFKFATLIFIASILVGCSKSSVRIETINIASLNYNSDDETIEFILYEIDYLKPSFIEEPYEDENLDIEKKPRFISIEFDSIDQFNSWASKYFNGDLITYQKKSYVFHSTEVVKFDNSLFFEEKFSMYEETPEKEAYAYGVSDCDGFFLPVPSCFDSDAYVYDVKSDVYSDDKEFKMSIEDRRLDVTSYNNLGSNELIIPKKMTALTTYTYTKIKFINIILTISLIGVIIALILRFRNKVKKENNIKN